MGIVTSAAPTRVFAPWSSRHERTSKWRERSSTCWQTLQPADQLAHARLDLVANSSDRVEILARRVLELPIFVTLAGIDGAGIAAPHRDHYVRGLHHVAGQRLGQFGADVHADLTHRLDDAGIEPFGRLAARRSNRDAPLG